jgi:hypothetical protein
MTLEMFDEMTGNWVVRELKETNPVIKEIKKIEALGDSSRDYKYALVQVIDEMTSVSLNGIKSVRN